MDPEQQSGAIDKHSGERPLESAPSGGRPERPVFVISTGRSGSTLVQRLLNCHPDLVVWGEHFGFLSSLGHAYAQMHNPDQVLYQRNPGPEMLLPTLQDPGAQLEWVNPWSRDDFKVQVMRFIEGYFAERVKPGQRWGFKEIRYNNLPTLRMLRELYPQGRFIFIKRDPIEVTRSKVFSFVKEQKWSTFGKDEKFQRIRAMLQEVRNHYHVYDTFMQRFPRIGQVVSYEKLVAEPPDVIDGMLAFLGLDQQRFDWLLGEQVMASIIARTKRDDDLTELIGTVSNQLAAENL